MNVRHNMVTTLVTIGWVIGGCGSSLPKSTAQHAQDHFDPKGKQPSEYTRKMQEALRKSLPFDDKEDFAEQKKGFIAAPDYKQIMNSDGKVAWDMGAYGFLLQGKDFDSIHPSLQRQAILNMNYGLFEVIPGIYQIRGYDLANITFIKGNKGWIIFDPLTIPETAKAALDFINAKLGQRPVTAVVFSHSHGDHFGGVRGVVDEADVRSGKVKIIAPDGFMKHAISENVYAGNAMNRRMYFQYGVLLPASPYGHVDQSIGKNVAKGKGSLIAPTMLIKDDFETHTVDGVQMVFQNTPGTEAPAEMNTYFPQKKAFWAAENVTNTIHNIYTLRGALVRDSLEWSKQINAALYKFGREAEIMFASHSWPRWGNERIQKVLRGQRDTYAHLNNQVLHLANRGVTINEIHNVYEVPKSLQQQWFARSYHGSVMHNSRAVINRYLGYWDGNPATLTPLSPKDSAPLYVEMMGGASPIIARATELFNQGKYLLAQEILNKLIYAQPNNKAAKELLADTWEQLGYQYESPSVRNSFLAAAYELRSGIPKGSAAKSVTPDIIRAMSTELFLDFLGIRLDSRKAENMAFKINLILPDNGEKFAIELSNATLTNMKGVLADKPDLTIATNRSDLETLMGGTQSFEALVKAGKIKLDGNPGVLEQLKSAIVHFEVGFEILPGTKSPTENPKIEPFQQEEPGDGSGG